MEEDNKLGNNFFKWLSKTKSSLISVEMQRSYAQINTLLMKSGIIRRPIVKITSTNDIEEALDQLTKVFVNKRIRNTASKLLSFYLTYLQENTEASDKMEIIPDIKVQDSWIKFDFTNAHNFECTKPCYCAISGEIIDGKNWTRILVGLTEHELAMENPALEELYRKPLIPDRKNRPYLMKSKIDGLNCSQLSNGYWINVNHSIPKTMELIKTLCFCCGYQENQILLYGVPKDAFIKKKDPIFRRSEKEDVEQQNNIDANLQEMVEKLLLESDLEGMTLKQLSEKIPSASMISLKYIRDHSDKIITLFGSMLHADALVDLDYAAEIFHEIIEKLFTKNNGYVSSAQLFEYVRLEMQMFLNDNDIFDEQKIFCIVRFLFGKIDWHGYHYEFSAGRHISRNGQEALRTNMDVFEKFARDQGGVFRWDDLLKYLDKVGIKPNNLRIQMGIGSRPIFFYYSSNELITAESMRIDDTWIDDSKRALRNLFDDVGDHIVVRDIAYYWYEQLPELPLRLPWTPILLQYILRFYGKRLGARTIHSEMPLQYDTIHALLVNDDSKLNTFGDAIVVYVIDNEIEERRFQAEQLRRLLVYGKLIGEFELIGNMPRAIGNDPRFAWDAAEENVNIIL